MPSDEIVERLRKVGANLGQAIAGYRDKDFRYSAEGLAEAASASSLAADTIESLRAALQKAAPHVCSLLCPSQWRTDNGPPPHHETCDGIRKVLTDV